jgi:hypothetical protein
MTSAPLESNARRSRSPLKLAELIEAGYQRPDVVEDRFVSFFHFVGPDGRYRMNAIGAALAAHARSVEPVVRFSEGVYVYKSADNGPHPVGKRAITMNQRLSILLACDYRFISQICRLQAATEGWREVAQYLSDGRVPYGWA